MMMRKRRLKSWCCLFMQVVMEIDWIVMFILRVFVFAVDSIP